MKFNINTESKLETLIEEADEKLYKDVSDAMHDLEKAEIAMLLGVHESAITEEYLELHETRLQTIMLGIAISRLGEKYQDLISALKEEEVA